MKRMIIMACVLLMLSGCATKRYGRLQPVSNYEATHYECKDIELEIAKVDSFDQQVKDEAQFSGMSVASFLGDFGIGNVEERHAAEKTSAQRRTELTNLYAAKHCGSIVGPATAPEIVPAAIKPQPGTASAAAVIAAKKMGCDEVSAYTSPDEFIAMCGGFHTIFQCVGDNCRPIRAIQ